MKHILKINEYVEEIVEKPIIKKAIEAPATVETMLKRIANRFNSLISKSSNESLDDNLGLSKDFMDSLKGQFEPEDVQGAMQDSEDILRLLSSIRQTESEMSEEDKKDKAMEIVLDIFNGKGFDISKLDFKLDILNDSDLMDAKSNIIGVPPEEFKEVKKEIEEENPKLKKEIDVRAIQNALTQGFATSIKDDFVTGDNEIEGVSFGDYYSLMNKTFGLYSKVPKELMHQVMTQSPALGRVELVWNEDKNKYTIEASGYTILILVHEMVKGILELISLHRDPKLDAEDEETMMALSGTQFSERDGLQYGPGMVNKFKEFFLKVEDNLLKDREIQERNPAMMLNVLSRFYKLEDDLFLRVSKAIFSDDENKPYELFEEFYIDGLQGMGFRRRDDGPQDPSDDPGDGPTPPSDDALRDLLSGAGISLNFDPPLTEVNKHIFGFNLYQILESKKDLLDKWSKSVDRSVVVDYISKFNRITNNPKGELQNMLVSKIPGVRVEQDLNARRNIEQYSFPELRALVDYIAKKIKIPVVSSLKQGDINPAISTIQDKLGLEKTGFYDNTLENKVREFQKNFTETISDDYDWREIYDKYQNVGLTNLSAKEKIQLAKSAEFIKTVEEIIKEKEVQIRNKVANELENLPDGKERNLLEDEILVEFEKITNIKRELKTIRSILGGGIAKPSGKMDQATISALAFDKGISKLEGLGDNGTLKPVGGELVVDNVNYRIHRVLGHNFCVQTRESFERVLREAGATQGASYGWCIAQSENWYRSYRTNASKKQTIYFVENKQRAKYEAEKWAQWLSQRRNGGESNYLRWRVEQAPGPMTGAYEKIIEEGNRKFYDNFHIAVVFVKENPGNPNAFWLVGASNNGQWGDSTGSNKHLSFKQIFDKIWPATEDMSIRKPEWSTGGGGPVRPTIQVTDEIIKLPFYHVPSSNEAKDLEENVFLPFEVSKRERNERNSRSIESQLSNSSISDSEFNDLNFDQKQQWIQNIFLTQGMITEFLDNRNKSGINIKIWKVLPEPLKELYIKGTVGATLPIEHLDEIKESPKLIKLYQDFVKRRLVGPDGEGGIIDKLKETSRYSELKKLILSNSDLDLISKPYDFSELKRGKAEVEQKLKDFPLSGKLSTRQSMMRDIKSRRIKLEQYMNLILRYRQELSGALDRIKKEDGNSITISRKNLEEFKRIEDSIEYSKILQGANSRFDFPTKSTDENGNKLKFFSDIVEKNPEIDKLTTDWKKVPNYFDKLSKGLKTGNEKVSKTLRTAIIKLIHVILARSGAPIEPNSSSKILEYKKELENAFNYIKNMSGDNEFAISSFLTAALGYFRIFEYAKKMRKEQADKLYELYDEVLAKHPFLISSGGFKKSSTMLGKPKESDSRANRPWHQEEL